MSPIEASRAELARLVKAVRRDGGALDELRTRITSAATEGDDAPHNALVAVLLHRYYVALESLCERVA